MKSSAFYNIFLALFIIGSIVSAYYLYSLPVSLEEGSTAVSPGVINDLSPVFLKLNLSMGITLLLGIYCIFLLAAKSRKQNVVEKIVYVDKNQEATEGEKETTESEADLAKQFSEIETEVKQNHSFASKSEALINALCKKIDAGQGILYQAIKTGSKRQIKMVAAYAYSLPDSESLTFEFGEGLAGQAAKEGKPMKVDQVPDGYINIISGLGSSSPSHLLIKPIVINGKVEAVVELASFKTFTAADEALIEKSISLLENNIVKEKGKNTEEKPQKETGSSRKDK